MLPLIQSRAGKKGLRSSMLFGPLRICPEETLNLFGHVLSSLRKMTALAGDK